MDLVKLENKIELSGKKDYINIEVVNYLQKLKRNGN